MLVADDDPFSRAMAVSRLAALDVSVIEAENGEKAMQALQDHKVDLAIIDLEMPVIDGFMLLGCIRGHPRLKHIPVVVLTTSKAQEDIYRTYELGVNSFITKPVTFNDLTDIVRTLTHYSELFT